MPLSRSSDVTEAFFAEDIIKASIAACTTKVNVRASTGISMFRCSPLQLNESDLLAAKVIY